VASRSVLLKYILKTTKQDDITSRNGGRPYRDGFASVRRPKIGGRSSPLRWDDADNSGPRSSSMGCIAHNSQSLHISLLRGQLHFIVTHHLRPVLESVFRRLIPRPTPSSALRPRLIRCRLSPLHHFTVFNQTTKLFISPSCPSDYARSQQCRSILQTRQADYR
jgi:hypothetical protein